ncbi:MAG TPA: hypothetical protein DCO77_09315 [Nitrospiraceae bacterium]|nr:hypothetical protein [Nitrospiraceae bacterium]
MVHGNGRKHILGILVLSLGINSCATIAGDNDSGAAAQKTALRIDFVETLRNEASLRGERFNEIARAADKVAALQMLQRPSSVYADPFRVYVTDTYRTDEYVTTPPTILQGDYSARIFVFDRGRQTVKIFGPPPSPPSPAPTDDVKLLSPTAIAVDATGVIFVADAQQGWVFGFDRNGRMLMTIGKGGELARPKGLAVDTLRNRVYVADSSARLVKAYTSHGQERVYTSEGYRRLELGRSSNPSENFATPRALALDRLGNIYVLDSKDLRVFVYDHDGKFRRMFPVADAGGGISQRLRGIAVDSEGHVYVTDVLNNRILIFSREGRFLQTWGKTGSLIGDFWTPSGIFIDARDNIYIADETNGRIQVYQYGKQ